MVSKTSNDIPPESLTEPSKGGKLPSTADGFYADNFAFSENPFTIVPNPRFFYANDNYEKACISVLNGIRKRKGVNLLTGELGTGKTTVIQQVANRLDNFTQAVFLYSPPSTLHEVINFILKDLGLRPPDRKSPDNKVHVFNEIQILEKIQVFKEFLVAQSRQGGAVVLFVDDAHFLDEEILVQLLSLADPNAMRRSLLQTVLVGLPELEGRLNSLRCRQFPQYDAPRHRLCPLRIEDVSGFIRHRLHVTGVERDDLFSPEAIRRIAVYSNGIPWQINTFCGAAVFAARRDARPIVTADMVDKVKSERPFLRLALSENPDQPSDLRSNISAPLLPFGSANQSAHLPKSDLSTPHLKQGEVKPSPDVATEHALTLLKPSAPSTSASKASAPRGTKTPAQELGRELEHAETRLLGKSWSSFLQQAKRGALTLLLAGGGVTLLMHYQQMPDQTSQVQASSNHGENMQEFAHGVSRLLKVEEGQRALLPTQDISADTALTKEEAVEASEETPQPPSTLGQSLEHAEVLPGVRKADSGIDQLQIRDDMYKLIAGETETAQRLLAKQAPLGTQVDQSGENKQIRDAIKDGTAQQLDGGERIETLKKPTNDVPAYNDKSLLANAERGDTHAVKFLLTAAVSPNAQDCVSGVTAMMIAAMSGHTEVIKALIEAGADVDAKDKDGNTALTWALTNNQTEAAQLLLDNNADINASTDSGETALLYAAWNGHISVVDRLLEKGANVDARNNDGWSALINAAINGHTASVKALLDAGADPNVTTYDARTALMAAAWNGHLDIVQTLIESDVDLNAVSHDGWTALMFAAWKGHAEIVTALMERGANVNAENDEHQTAAIMAAQQGYSDVVKLVHTAATSE